MITTETLMQNCQSVQSGPLHIWKTPAGIFADGLFAMHDSRGFSLASSLIECMNRDWTPCLGQFVADAVRAGWTRAKAVQVVREAIAESSAPATWGDGL